MGEEFDALLRRAFDRELTEPLLFYVEQNELGKEERQKLTGWIRHLLGRNTGPPWPPTFTNAERNAAWLVEFMRAHWRKQHGRERVPGDVIDKMIADAIRLVAADLGIVTDKLSPDEIRRHLKTGRIKVRGD